METLFNMLVRLCKKAKVAPKQDLKTYTETFDIDVLVAEDDPVNQKLALTMFSKFGCKADLAKNGKEAVAKVLSNKYDLVFMDCQMPEMDGLEATRQIRRTLRRTSEKIPPVIVAMTAHAMSKDKERCLEAGMDDYISKPVRQVVVKSILVKYFPENRHSD
jgi:CheY-like chemotaxis protein